MSDTSEKPPAERDWERQLREVNDALLVSSVRQHELTEQAQQAKAALAEGEEQLRFAIEVSPIPVIMHAEDGEVLRISRSWTELTGYTIEDRAILQTWLTKAYGYGGDDVRTAVKRLFESERPMRAVEFDVVTRGGDHRVWSFSASSPGALRDGRRFIVGMAEDITDRKHAEQALQESEQRLATELAATKHLQEISTELIREDKVDALHNQILDAAIAIMHSDMASMQTVDPVRDVLRLLSWRGFEPQFGEIFELTGPDTKTSCSVARRLGSRVVVPDVETWDFLIGTPALEDHRKTGIRAVQSTPLFSRDGQLVGMISTHWRQPHEPSERELRMLDVLARQAADLIERSQADEALRESEKRFRVMANSSPVMIWMTNAEGHSSFLNRACLEYFGMTDEAAPAFEWSDLVHPDDREAYGAAFRTALQKRQPFHQRVRLRRFDGQWRWFEPRGNPILNDDDNMTGFIVNAPDITDI